MSFHSLPLELVRSIVEQDCLTRKDLRSLALTYSPLRDEAQHKLFRNPGQLLLGHQRFSQDKFLDSIIGSPNRLAPMVRVYSQVIDWQKFRNIARRSGYSWEMRRIEREARQTLILGKIRRALQLMVNLKYLAHEERIRQDKLVHTISSILTDKCCFQLISLNWTYVAKDGIQEELELFHRFLPRQLALQSLRLVRLQIPQELVTPKEDFYTIARSVCPQLEDLSAPLDFIMAVLPMKPAIKRLSWQMDNDINGPINLPRISGSLKNLEILDYRCNSYGWRHDSVSELSLMCPHLKNLVLLSVDLLSAIQPTILSQLPRLRIVALTLNRESCSTDLDPVKLALLQCQSLKYIDISNILGGREPYYSGYSPHWYFRYSLDSDNALISKALPIEERFDWQNMRWFHIP